MIDLQNVAYSYGGGDLLSRISMTLEPGSFHFLTGPSGAGKSTFLKLCYMELAPTTGRICVFGRDAASIGRDGVARARQRIGVVHQECQFLEHLSVAENVALPLTVSGRGSAHENKDLRELLAWVGLKDKFDALPPQLSGGERQRVALARAVITDPEIILADEPTGNVDWEMSERLLTLLAELNRMGKSIVIATHDLRLVRAVKKDVNARVLRISQKTLQVAGAEL